MLRKSGHRHPLVLFAALGPPLAIALIRPYGDAYAYARYVMPSLVPFFLLVGLGVEPVGRGPSGMGSRSIALLGGASHWQLGSTAPSAPGHPGPRNTPTPTSRCSIFPPSM